MLSVSSLFRVRISATATPTYSCKTVEALKDYHSRKDSGTIDQPSIVLHLYPPCNTIHGHPLSFDFESLVCALYCRLANIPLALIDRSGEALQSTEGYLPAASIRMVEWNNDGEEEERFRRLSGCEPLVQYFRSHGPQYDLDSHLSQIERATVQAFISLINNRLKPALIFEMFCNPKTFKNYTKQVTFGAQYPWIIRSVISWNEQSSAIRWLETKLTRDSRGSIDVEKLYSRFRDALRDLTIQLTSNSHRYFVDDQPTTLDVYAYALIDLVYSLGSPASTLTPEQQRQQKKQQQEQQQQHQEKRREQQSQTRQSDQAELLNDFSAESPLRGILFEFRDLMAWYRDTQFGEWHLFE